MFKIGQKVVCIEKFNGFHVFPIVPCNNPLPQLGEIYTIEGINPFRRSLYLKELNSINRYGKRIHFVPYKFRPLDETFAEETLKNIAEQIEQEQLVLI